MPLNAGIWEYDENETVSPTWSEHLNKLGSSVRSALATRLDDTGNVSLTPAAGFSSSNARARRKQGRTVAGGSFVTTAPISIGPAYMQIGTVPETGQVRPLFSGGNYTSSVFGVGVVQVVVNTSGAILARSIAGTLSLPAGATIGLDGFVWDV